MVKFAFQRFPGPKPMSERTITSLRNDSPLNAATPGA